MSSDANLPPYSEKPSAASGGSVASPPSTVTPTRMAGNVQTCSIRDLQVDYLKVVRDSATSYHICLTVDPTPLYYVEFGDGATAGDIQIFAAAADTALPIAAARLLPEPESRNDPIAVICTAEPHLPDARWRAVTQTDMLAIYSGVVPIVPVPGLMPIVQKISWCTSVFRFQLWWEGPFIAVPAFSYNRESRDLRYLLATVMKRSPETGNPDDNLIEIRRGGGLEFELSVVLGMFVVLHHKKQQLV